METQKTTTVINNLTKDVQTISNNTPQNAYCRRVAKKHFFGIHSLINNLHNVLLGVVL